MAYRFNGTSDFVEFGIGPFTGYTFGPVTVAVFLKRGSAATGGVTVFTTAALSANFLTRFLTNQFDLRSGGFSMSSPQTPNSTSLWYLLVVTWAGNPALARFHVHDGTSWSHGNTADVTFANYVVGGTDRLRFGDRAAFLSADVVCAGIKKADSTDPQVEALSPAVFQAWRNFSFDWLVGFDSSLESAGVLQDQASPGTGDEVGISGTSQVSDPVGWSWTAVASAAPAMLPSVPSLADYGSAVT